MRVRTSAQEKLQHQSSLQWRKPLHVQFSSVVTSRIMTPVSWMQRQYDVPEQFTDTINKLLDMPANNVILSAEKKIICIKAY